MAIIRGIFFAFLICLVVLLGTSIFLPDSGFSTFVKAEMAPIMFFSLVVFLLLGYPVAFSLAALGLLAAFGAFAVMGAHTLTVAGQLSVQDGFEPSAALLLQSAWTPVADLVR